MGRQDILDEAAEIVYQKLDSVGGDPMKLPKVMQPIAILYSIQAMVDNGGFRYIFENNFPFMQPYPVWIEAYRQIGAVGPADCLERAVALFPFENPHLDIEARNKFMDSLAEDDSMFILGDMVCGDEQVWELMKEYVNNHRDIFLPLM